MNQAVEPVETGELSPLKLRQISAYGAGDFGFAIMIHMVGLFLMYFYTDIFGISAAAAGWIFMITRIWDAVNDPLMGYIADRTETRWGKYRPYLLFGVIPLAVLNILLFITPDFGSTGKFIWALVIYTFWGMAYTATNLPYGSLTAVYTQNPKERTALAASRIFFGMPGIIFISIVTPIIVSIYPDRQVSYPVAAAIYSVIAVLLIWMVFGVVKERVYSQHHGNYPLKEMLSMILQNKPLLIVSVAMLLVQTALTIRIMMTKYYFQYIIGRYNSGGEAMFPIFMTMVIASMMIGGIVSPPLNRFMSKKNILVLGMILFVVGDLGIFFSPYTAIGFILACSIFAGLGTGMIITLIWSLVADTVEYGEWKTGRRSEGVTYSFNSFAAKLATAIGGGVGGFLLHASGYVPHALQTPETEFMITALFALGPVIAGSLAVIMMQFYKLDAELFQKILNDLKERRK